MSGVPEGQREGHARHARVYFTGVVVVVCWCSELCAEIQHLVVHGEQACGEDEEKGKDGAVTEWRCPSLSPGW